METLSGVDCVKKYTNGDTYKGNVKNLKADGFGTLILKNGNSFEGQFVKDYIEPNGRGKLTGTFQVELRDERIEIREIQEQIMSPEHYRSEESERPMSSSDEDDDDFSS